MNDGNKKKTYRRILGWLHGYEGGLRHRTEVVLARWRHLHRLLQLPGEPGVRRPHAHAEALDDGLLLLRRRLGPRVGEARHAAVLGQVEVRRLEADRYGVPAGVVVRRGRLLRQLRGRGAVAGLAAGVRQGGDRAGGVGPGARPGVTGSPAQALIRRIV